MSGAKNIPGLQDGGVQSAGDELVFALGAHGDVGLHHRRGMSNADVDEMPHPRLDRGGNCCLRRYQVNVAKLGGLGWVRMGHANHVDKRVSPANVSGVLSSTSASPGMALQPAGSLFADCGRTSA